MKITRYLRALFSGGLKGHFGQYAEDTLLRKFFPSNTSSGVFLDIGAYHPFKHSNSAFFWLRGWKCVNVDANPVSIKLFNRYRPTDSNIWAAMVTQEELKKGLEKIDFFIPRGRSGKIDVSGTGSVEPVEETDKKDLIRISVPTKSINQIVSDCGLTEIDILSIDAEGSDEKLIKDLDFSRNTPRMIVIEDFSDSFEKLLSSGITVFLADKGYKLVGRAGWSSIFSYKGQSY